MSSCFTVNAGSHRESLSEVQIGIAQLENMCQYVNL